MSDTFQAWSRPAHLPARGHLAVEQEWHAHQINHFDRQRDREAERTQHLKHLNGPQHRCVFEMAQQDQRD